MKLNLFLTFPETWNRPITMGFKEGFTTGLNQQDKLQTGLKIGIMNRKINYIIHK